ncbi:c-type cytochrome [Veronia pacifica]|uniref:Cytochrome c domain-containing protein n=1 Tax=Veronia pacifica TaxID=1080227 RepID=A0A1C3EI87_9GAMM|nr:hypothetical protein [Veronia pacifica]ODA32954.1 hypothetical protein A8L45_12530 [Veronia pacifica]
MKITVPAICLGLSLPVSAIAAGNSAGQACAGCHGASVIAKAAIKSPDRDKQHKPLFATVINAKNTNKVSSETAVTMQVKSIRLSNAELADMAAHPAFTK